MTAGLLATCLSASPPRPGFARNLVSSDHGSLCWALFLLVPSREEGFVPATTRLGSLAISQKVDTDGFRASTSLPGVLVLNCAILLLRQRHKCGINVVSHRKPVVQSTDVLKTCVARGSSQALEHHLGCIELGLVLFLQMLIPGFLWKVMYPGVCP